MRGFEIWDIKQLGLDDIELLTLRGNIIIVNMVTELFLRQRNPNM